MFDDKTLSEKYGLTDGQIKALKEMEENAQISPKEAKKHKKRPSFGTHDFSRCLLEGYSAEDYVWNYFHNQEAVMPSVFIQFAKYAKELKNRYKNNEMSLSKVSKELVSAWEHLMSETAIIDPSTKDSLDYVKDILDSIPDDEDNENP